MRVVQRRIGAVDLLVGVGRAGEAERRGLAVVGAAVHVDGDDVAVVHLAAVVDDQRTVVATVGVLADLLVAAGAARLGVGQAFPLIEHFAGLGVDDEMRPRQSLAGNQVGDVVDQLGDVVLAQADHQFHFVILGLAALGLQALGLGQHLLGGYRRGGAARQVGSDVGDEMAAALRRHALAGTLDFGDGFADHPYAVVELLVAGDLLAVGQGRAADRFQFVGTASADRGLQGDRAGRALGSLAGEFGHVDQVGGKSGRRNTHDRNEQQVKRRNLLHLVQFSWFFQAEVLGRRLPPPCGLIGTAVSVLRVEGTALPWLGPVFDGAFVYQKEPAAKPARTGR